MITSESLTFGGFIIKWEIKQGCKGDEVLNIYKPYVLIFLLLINIGWIYALSNYSTLVLPEIVMISAPLVFGIVIYLIGYIKFVKLNQSKEI